MLTTILHPMRPMLKNLLALLTAAGLFLNCSFKDKVRWAHRAMTIEQKPNEATKFDWMDQKPDSHHVYFSPSFQRDVDQKTFSYLSAGNEIHILANKDSHKTKLHWIQKAKHSVYLSSLHIHCDQGGEEFTSVLIKAKQRGIDVRIILDGGFWGSFGASCQNRLEKADIPIGRSPYHWPFKNNFKLHDKLMVVDADIAIVGGQNIGSLWSESNGKDRLFRDTDALVKGPVVLSVALRFVTHWKITNPNDSTISSYEQLLEQKNKHYQKNHLVGVENYKQWLSPKNRKGLCRFVTQDPYLNTFYVFDAYTLYAQKAKSQILFQVPSLNALGSPQQETFLNALVHTAQMPRARVDVITNGPGLLNSDIVDWRLAGFYGLYTLSDVYDSVQGTPIRVHAYHYWIHSKVYYFDHLAVGIGGFNFDESGLSWTENTLICLDPTLVQESSLMFKNDLTHSTELETPLLNEPNQDKV